MAIYCISDIHGKRDEFYQILDKINFKEEDHLYIVGDIVDRTKDGIKLFQEVMEMDNVTVIKGNHEDMCYKSMTGDMDEFKNWTKKRNGGYVTYRDIIQLDKFNRSKVLYQMNSLPMYKIITVNNRKFLLVHAGLYKYGDKSLEESLDVQYDNLLWIRDLFFGESFNHFDCTIVFGHTVTVTIPWYLDKEPKDSIENWHKYVKESYIWKSENKIGIDCGASYGGRLACLRLDDMEEFYIEC